MIAKGHLTHKTKGKILALHGMSSNQTITKLQLNNLGLDEKDFDVVYLDGTIQVTSPDHSLLEMIGLIEGPWYSWLPPKEEWKNLARSELLNKICIAIEHVLDAIDRFGPFDLIYGFSQGGYIANLVNSLANDPLLFNAYKEYKGILVNSQVEFSIPFKSIIYACVGTSESIKDLRRYAGLSVNVEHSKLNQSIYLIGRNDPLKPWSESFVLDDNSPNPTLYYLDGAHEINNIIPEKVKYDLKHILLESRPEIDNPVYSKRFSSRLSTRIVDPMVQVVDVSIDTAGQPKTIIELLKKRPSSSALFRNARCSKGIYTTYGEVLSFISPGGEGDLRRVGVKKGQVVAYLAPQGGTAEGAVSFLTVTTQACAVPLSASMTKTEALIALKQLKVDHIILFEAVNAKGVIDACKAYCESHNCYIHNVSAISPSLPGLFKFKESFENFLDSPELITQADDDCLLLRTSGTTSTPKVVPLKQKDLVINSAILADSIGINEFDITYSIMPLDHMGGISASLLASLSVGAAMTCDGLYNPQLMVEAIIHSHPKPTWYSVVPTIQVATLHYLQTHHEKYLDPEGVWSGHNIRLIRSGAAAIKEEDRIELIKTYDCPVLPTYSMSELMPISQPAQTDISWEIKASSVGVPLVASLTIVDPITFKPQPYGVAGEVAISGETVFAGYKDNPDANSNSRFLMQMPNSSEIRTWFLTGDLGTIDAFGHLTLEGRLKELIKKGGEQIAPAEIEDRLTSHPSIDVAICFSVPSETYGEEVGCAIVSNDSQLRADILNGNSSELRTFLIKGGVSIHKLPTIWRIVDRHDIPMTNSKKYKRNSMAEFLGISTITSVENTEVSSKDPVKNKNNKTLSLDKPKVDWDTIAGFRFILACYVMFMHFGSNNSWEAFNNLRQFQWHVNSFFILAGFSLAILMPTLIQKKFAFIKARITVMYPLYALAILFAMGNLFISCQPSTFIPDFSWGPLSHSASSYCQGTPWIEGSWFANVLFSLGIHATGLQATPLWGASWFIGFYLWFISMYFQCIIVFPMIYNALYKSRGNVKRILIYTALCLGLNAAILMGFWYGFAADFVGYGLFDAVTGLRTIPSAEQVTLAGHENALALGFYLFAPFWMVYFLLGMCAAFLYDAIKPTEQKRAYLWGYVADTITLIIICVSIAHISQGFFYYGPDVSQVSADAFFMRPEAANSYADPAVTNRIWDEIYSRSFAPLTLLWIFALSTGQGITARILRVDPLSKVLAPTAYACFLFHQMIGQWYYAATRNGEWWNWWDYRKSFYWFSPEPVPVEWYEYFYLVGLVVIFAKLIQPADDLLRNFMSMLLNLFKKPKDKQVVAIDTAEIVLDIATKISGLEVDRELSLNDNGLASLGVVRFISEVEKRLSTQTRHVSLPISDIISAKNLNEVIEIVNKTILNIQKVDPDKAYNIGDNFQRNRM